jgi:hypothetical protein
VKIVAAILATLTLFMSVQKPVLYTEMDVPGKESCSYDPVCGKKNDSCKKNDTPAKETKDPKRCCDMGICNPFGTCCSYLLTGNYNLDLACILPAFQKLKLTDENGLSFYSQEVWKPPKFLAALS